MFRKFILFVSAILCMAGVTYAQKTCGTDDVYNELLKTYPQLADMQEQFNKQVREAISHRTTSATDTTVYDIPLVIHVIHDYGTEDLSDNVLYQAVLGWADIYMCRNTDTSDVIAPFKKYVGDPRIRLHLATIDPNGNPTHGITRFKSYLTNGADEQAKFQDWPQNKYVNIWFINTFGASKTGTAAYAYYPGSAPTYYDGVICLASYADYAKTVPHELGHVLNLQHPWGNTNQPAVACGDDQVDDTPPTKGHTQTGCTNASLYDTACAAGYIKGGIDYPDTVNAQNIMDYTYCQRMFTKLQVVRMRTALLSSTGSRSNLYSSANLTATGALAPWPDLAPIADYVVNRGNSTSALTDSRTYFLTINNSALFKFQNWSWNDTVSSVAWTFSNGATTPTSTSMTTVTTQFTQPGWVTLSLTATSNAGSNTLTDTHAVYAADTVVAGVLGYSQKFATVASVSNWPMFNFYNNQFQWQYYSGVGFDDAACVRFRSYDTSTKKTGSPVGDRDDFYTPAFDLTNSPAPSALNIYFNTAGASVSSSGLPETPRADSFTVEVSTSGGQRWTRLASFFGTDVANNGVKTGEYVPAAASEWKTRTVAIDPIYQTSNTFFRFRFFAGNTGNNVYFDNFSIGQYPAGVLESLNASNLFSIYPNPTATGFNMVFKTGNDGIVNYTIKDVTGKVVYQHSATFAPNSVQQETISRTATPAAGMYFVTVSINGANMTQKLVVY